MSASLGLGFQVMRCCDLLKEGKNLTEVKAELLRIQDKSRVYFVVDDLEYLFRGGRISRISKQIGNLLQLKPVLTLNEGQIEVFDKVRTKPKAIRKILQLLQDDSAEIEKLAVIHVDNEEEASKILREIETFYPGPILIAEAGPVIGTHTGPGTIGLAYY